MFAARAANVKPGETVVGDAPVGVLGVLSARQIGAERIIAVSRQRREKRSRASRAFTPCGIAPLRRCLPKLIRLVRKGKHAAPSDLDLKFLHPSRH